MKTLITIILISLFCSCVKEYECTQTLKTTQVSKLTGEEAKVNYQWFSSFKGTRKEMKEYEKAGSYSINDINANGITIGTCEMKCR
jgi:hypothetical protein